ncbi:MAG: NADH-quinone oxidoreductase subunit I, partial [Candidatus Zixiibacteriota bacterium]
MGVFKGLKELIAGLGITGKHLGRHAITIQYPEERWTMPERSRGMVVLLSDKETGELNCTACLLCMKACPTGAIVIKAPRNPETKKRELQSFTVDNTLCCYCGLCQEACNFCAIKLATKYEFSALNRDDLIWDVHKLQEVG